MRYISQMRKHRCESSGQSRFIFRAAGTLFNAQTESETRILWCEKTRKPNRAPHRLANSQITLPRVPVRRSKNSVPRSFFKTRIGASRLERRRIARELHDSLGQKVSGLKMKKRCCSHSAGPAHNQSRSPRPWQGHVGKPNRRRCRTRCNARTGCAIRRHVIN